MLDDENGKTPPPSSPAAQRGPSERQKKAEELRAQDEAMDQNARLAAENALLKAALEKEKKRKESGSGEAANPKNQRQKLPNAST